jgi:hypothetical protein
VITFAGDNLGFIKKDEIGEKKTVRRPRVCGGEIGKIRVAVQGWAEG